MKQYVWTCECGAVMTINYDATEADKACVCGGELAWSHNEETKELAE
jgi:hypothetical protein